MNLTTFLSRWIECFTASANSPAAQRSFDGFARKYAPCAYRIAAVVTAVIAKDNATSGWNILIIVALGLFGLALGLIWWLVHRVEGPVSDRDTRSQSPWHCCKKVLRSFWTKLGSQYRWKYILVGLLLLFFAVLCLIFEDPGNYWMVHSSWHVFIFTAAFMLLLSTDLSGRREGTKDAVRITISAGSDNPSLHPDDSPLAASESTQVLLVSKTS
ncbi:hypothetical protein CBR_g17143 [Chara braunii]|uniref:Uncharacterized protein n=1 Tax=Chara braunii TaxID=69332 RepID=A0A388KUR3_CHABU|nr:hypothetical protein CBR_g17143 [Chara braunii]|eukprot:GBG73804.1 hypothetical protein CBR_g17143 [Chara braunii]